MSDYLNVALSNKSTSNSFSAAGVQSEKMRVIVCRPGFIDYESASNNNTIRIVFRGW